MLGGGTSLTYSSHYCAVDDPNHTTAVACSWIGSGVRVFDIRDPRKPREIAYYNPPANPPAARGHSAHNPGQKHQYYQQQLRKT